MRGERNEADFEVVHPAYLVPPDHPIRGFSRTDAGVVLDRELVALAAVHARLRCIQAKLVRRIADLRGWNHLGFVRLSDYARDVIGVSARALEDDARVMRALDDLPRMRELLESGCLQWSRARVLVRAATAENEARLLADSAAVPIRELDAFVREFSAKQDDGHISKLSRANRGHEALLVALDEGNDVDPAVTWSMSVPRRTRRLWRGAREFASRMAGKQVSNAELLELAAAETGAGMVHVGPDPDVWIRPAEFHEMRFRRRRDFDEERGRRTILAFLAEAGVIEGFDWLAPASSDPGPAASLDALLAGADCASPHEITERLVTLRTAANRIDAQMAALLFIGINRRLFREVGFATVRLYVEARLGCSSRTIWSLVAIERESWRRSPKLRAAWKQGLITQLQAMELLAVISETNAEAWIEHARGCTLRKLQDDVAWALERADAASSGHRPFPPADDVDTFDAGRFDPTEVQMCAHAEVGDPGAGARNAVRIECRVPLSVAVLVESTLDRLERPGEGRWQTFERMLALALLEWMAQPRHRDPVFERDSFRCTVPCCTSRRELHDHHLKFRSLGGDDARDNRTTVCAGHHLHGIHAGRIRATGRAPSDIIWEMGCAPGRKPWMKTVGDRIVDRGF